MMNVENTFEQFGCKGEKKNGVVAVAGSRMGEKEVFFPKGEQNNSIFLCCYE